MSDIALRPLNGMEYEAIEVRVEVGAPVWEALDYIANYFEDNGLEGAIIYSMTTEMDFNDEEYFLMTVIFSAE